MASERPMAWLLWIAKQMELGQKSMSILKWALCMDDGLAKKARLQQPLELASSIIMSILSNGSTIVFFPNSIVHWKRPVNDNALQLTKAFSFLYSWNSRVNFGWLSDIFQARKLLFGKLDDVNFACCWTIQGISYFLWNNWISGFMQLIHWTS